MRGAAVELAARRPASAAPPGAMTRQPAFASSHYCVANPAATATICSRSQR